MHAHAHTPPPPSYMYLITDRRGLSDENNHNAPGAMIGEAACEGKKQTRVSRGACPCFAVSKFYRSSTETKLGLVLELLAAARGGSFFL